MSPSLEFFSNQLNHRVQWNPACVVEIGKNLSDVDPISAKSWEFHLGKLDKVLVLGIPNSVITYEYYLALVLEKFAHIPWAISYDCKTVLCTKFIF